MQQHRKQLFEEWAQHYDSIITQNDSTFPFDGYDELLDTVVRLANVKPGLRVLDLGIGTGNLAVRFLQQGCEVWGVDFSTEMIAQAQVKLPQAHLVQTTLLNMLSEWPTGFPSSFDRIVSSYVLHEFDLATKIALLQQLAYHHLVQEGRIIVGDIAFPTVREREQAHQEWAKLWDDDEHYWAADETRVACERAGLQVAYQQISSCGGVFVFTRRRAG